MDKPVQDKLRSHFLFTVEIVAKVQEDEGTLKINVLTATDYSYVREVDIKRSCDSAMIQFMKSLPPEIAAKTTIQKTVILSVSFLGEMTETQFREVDEPIKPTLADLDKVAI